MSVLAFGGQDYYPYGGWNDYIGSFTTIAKAKQRVEAGYDVAVYDPDDDNAVQHYDYDWAHLVEWFGDGEFHKALWWSNDPTAIPSERGWSTTDRGPIT